MSEAPFAYIVARRWRTDEPFDLVDNCCIYTYGSQIQHGVMSQAMWFLGYVRRNSSSDAEREDYKIYALTATGVDVVDEVI